MTTLSQQDYAQQMIDRMQSMGTSGTTENQAETNQELTIANELQAVEGINSDELLRQQADIASNFMNGVIPQADREQMIQASQEGAMYGGVGTGQAATYLTARDIGSTQTALMTTGAEQAGKINTFLEGRRQFQQQYSLDRDALADKMRNTDISSAQQSTYDRYVTDQNNQFNATSTFNMNKLISNTTLDALGYQVQAGSNDVDSGFITEAIDPLLVTLNHTIKTIGA